jgi:hypothetical protein
MAMLLGLFVVPAWLLWAGHHWRGKSPRMKGAFWGGVVGHTVAALLASIAGMYRPVLWAPTDMLRGLLGFWFMLLLGVAGIAIGAAVGGRSGKKQV